MRIQDLTSTLMLTEYNMADSFPGFFEFDILREDKTATKLTEEEIEESAKFAKITSRSDELHERGSSERKRVFVSAEYGTSPFDELLKRGSAERQDIINRIKNLPFVTARAIYERLKMLIEITEEEYPEERLISADSLRDFAKFLELETTWIGPEIGVSVRGNISAEWYVDDSHHLALEFLGKGTVKYVMFAPDNKRPEKTVPQSGMPSIEDFLEAVEPYHVRSWITHGQR